MGQMLVRQLSDAAVRRLRERAGARKTSVEALAREAIHKAAAELTIEEKLELIGRFKAKSEAAMAPGAVQTPGVELIREDRDR